ncbi:CYTH and CHAD domain-containing protein [Glaciihabitans sp. dw_435]|uniref:CYTH and CHAD domain-containing protein n=1 Tax=Glaciihabitans sp. dw_435 TaxID=2720081 RepID=UPI001BD28993|nr:CYTH and CHAD domain-containing protein [Glaciihabitans sp. dw_435]
MAVTSMTETERKYDVDESTVVPDLSELGTVATRPTVTLRATYYDTADADLGARLYTFRRRTGGGDEGWHLKTPSIGGRTEFHSPLGEHEDEAPPSDLLDLIRSIIRRRELVPVALLTTERTTVHVLDDGGRAVVEVADDLVSATDVHTGILRIWREWEVELLEAAPTGAGDRAALLDAVEGVLLAAGAAPATSASKLARALGRDSLAPPRTDTEVDRSSTALQTVSAILSGLVDDLVVADPRVRTDESNSVHHMRTVARRIRGVLASARTVLDREVTDEIRDRLRQLGAVLGAARHVEVRRERALDLLGDRFESTGRHRDALPLDQRRSGADADDPLLPNADLRRRLVDDTQGEYGSRRIDVLAYLNSDEYLTLLDDLETLVARPPVLEGALLPARDEFRAEIHDQGRRTRRRLKTVDADDPTALHSSRKAARRLRYISEAVTRPPAAILGKKTRAIGSAAKAVQDAIGEHRDALLFLDYLGTTTHEAHEAGENTAGYGVLAELERRNAAAAYGRLGVALDALRKSLRA